PISSDNGVTISINGNCLTKNGNAGSGMVDLEYVEVFEKGNMLTTNKPTMGLMPNGDKALLITGGEFFLEATQDGISLETNCPLQLNVPTGRTGAADNGMMLGAGVMDERGDRRWDEMKDDPAGEGENGVCVEGTECYALFNEFG